MHDDLVRRDFTADATNRLWLADITEHPTGEGKLYLCAVKDVFSNRIVGYSIDSRMKSRIAVNALNNAVARRGDVAGCVFTPTGAVNFAAGSIVQALAVTAWSAPWAASGRRGQRRHGELLQPAAEERPGPPAWATREDLRIAIVTWIERTYHRRRRQDALGRLTPIEFETIMTTPATQAA